MRRLFAMLALLFVSALAGCSDSTGPNDSIAGNYSLRTVNGDPLPLILDEGPGFKDELLDETITIRDNGTFQQQGRFRFTDNGFVTIESYNDAGTFDRTGTNLAFRFTSDGSTATATVDNGSLIVAYAGVSLVYRR